MWSASRSLLLGSVVIGASLVIGGGHAFASGPAADPPFAVVVPQQASNGDFVSVVGGGFRPNSLVVVELCGQPGSYGAPSCNVGTTINARADDFGRVRTPLLIEPPEEGCPCWVRLVAISDVMVTQASLDVDGVPGETSFVSSSALLSAVPGELEISGLRVERGADVWSWFGWRSSATVRFSVVHEGGRPVRSVNVVVTYGKVASDGKRVSADNIPLLQSGDRREIAVPIDLGFLAGGSYTVVVAAVAEGASTTSTVQFSAFPWGLVIIAGLVVVEVILLLGRQALRRRLSVEVLGSTPNLPHDVAAAVLSSPPSQLDLGEGRPLLDAANIWAVVHSVLDGPDQRPEEGPGGADE